MKTVLLALSLCLAGAVGHAGTCPAAPDHDVEMSALFEQLGVAPSESDARALSDALWALWTDAPDEHAQALLDRGMGKRASYDFLGALQDLDALVAYCPAYAEGYNQRAFVHFLRQDFVAAERDLTETLALSPRHVGALSGMALTLMGLGQLDDARAMLNDALALNPWLPERGLVAKGGPLAPPGTDL